MSPNLTFESWELQARLAMAKQEINWDVADPLIEDAKLHWQASGQDPWTACGTPAEFAAAAAAEQPPDRKAALDQAGFTARTYLTDMFFVLTVVVIPWSLIAAVFEGRWSFGLTPARLVGGALFTATFIVLLGLPRFIRSSGRPRQAAWALVPILILMVATAAALTVLPDTHWLTVPVLGLDLAAAVAALLQLGPAKPTRPPAAPDPTSMTNDEWFRRLDGLLVGRHDLPPARAAALVAQTREHPSSSTSAIEEFGPVEIYAAEIAEREPVREFPAWIRLDKLTFVLFCLVLYREHLTDQFDDQPTWVVLALVSAVPALMLAGVVWETMRHARRPQGETSEP